VKCIDAHAHYAGDHPDTLGWMRSANVKLLNVAVAHGEDWRKRAEQYRDLAKEHPDVYGWCTSFDAPTFDEDDYAGKVISQLEQDFADGAVGVKLWKNIGMELKKPDGSFLMIDDEVFTPIFEHMAKSGWTLLLHLAEPLDCWRPLDEKNTLRTYYTNNPQWHMYGKSEYPHHRDIMAARDRIVERHRDLRIVGAHLASLEYDVAEMARRFEKWPNFAVDTCGPSRIVNLAQQDRDTVRRFFADYQDRIIYGSDVSTKLQSKLPAEEAAEGLETLKESFRIGWDYYATDKRLTVKGWHVHGLALDEAVLEKLFETNAEKWYPGL